MKKKFVILLIILIAVFSRFFLLDLRPLHHDEAVNYFFAKNIIGSGKFFYNYNNYHGPLYFFILSLSFILFKITEFSLRLPSAIFGVLLIFFAAVIKRKEYNPYTLALFFTLSPSLMYFSRYSIHESLFILLSFLAIYIFIEIIEDKNLERLPYLSIILGLLFTTKESAVILGFSMFSIFILNINDIKKINLNKKSFRMIITSIIIFISIYTLLFTSFFSNTRGFVDGLKGFMPWNSKDISNEGHYKPFFYYFNLLFIYEFPILLSAIFGLIKLRKKIKNNIFIKSIFIWFLTTFLVYSAIKYKTPLSYPEIRLPRQIR